MSLRLEFTDERFVYAGRHYHGIPLLVDGHNRFIDPVCDYLRHKVIYNHLKISSVKTYAEHIVLFWRFLERQRHDWKTIQDDDLINWQNQQAREHVSGKTIAARTDAVFAMYLWFEYNGYVCDCILIPGWNDDHKFTPQLTAVPERSDTSRKKGGTPGLVSGVRPRTTPSAKQHTPNSEEVTRLYFAADDPNNLELTERNQLLIDWYVQVGVRRCEWQALTLTQIPEWSELDQLQLSGEAFQLKLTRTKNGKVRHVGVLPELLEKTREYIEGPRKRLVERFKHKKSKAYKEPAEVFLSNKTGLPLALRAISNMLTLWFRAADVKGHGHRLRAANITNLAEAEIEAEDTRTLLNQGSRAGPNYDLSLLRVAEHAGHADIEYTRPYLNFAKKRKLRTEDVDEYVNLRQKVEAKRQELALLEKRARDLRTSLEKRGKDSP